MVERLTICNYSLLARLRAALRRAEPTAEPVLEIGGLRVDLEAREVIVDGTTAQLTPHEYALLRFLALNEGKLLTHKAILREVWGEAYADESHYLHVYVSQLRRKLEPDPARPRYILTEPGAGYRLVARSATRSSERSRLSIRRGCRRPRPCAGPRFAATTTCWRRSPGDWGTSVPWPREGSC